MSKGKFKGLIQSAKMIFVKNGPEILTGLGITGLVTTTIMAVKATPKAIMLINEEECKQHVEKLSTKDTIKIAWKCYVPSAIVGVSSIACIVGASNVSHKRNAALATAYAFTESTLKEYQEKVIEVIGEKKEHEIRSKLAEDKLVSNPVQTKEVILTEKGNTLCYDSLSGRYFKSDIETIRRIVNELNRKMISDMFITVNELYYELGLDGIKLGDSLGWDIDRGYLEIEFSSNLASDGTPCLVLNYTIEPKNNF